MVNIGNAPAAIFYFFFMIILHYVLTPMVINSIIEPYYTGSIEFLYLITYAIFIIASTILVPILIAIGKAKPNIAGTPKALFYLILMLIFDIVLINVVYTGFIVEFYEGQIQMIWTALLFLFIGIKTMVVPILLLLDR